MAKNIKVVPSLGIIELSGSNANTSISVNDSGELSFGSSANTGSLDITGDLTVAGTVTAQEFKTEFVSASIIYRSGSTKFGDTLDDTHSFTGSLEVTGSIDIAGSTFADKFQVLNSPSVDIYNIGENAVNSALNVNGSLRTAFIGHVSNTNSNRYDSMLTLAGYYSSHAVQKIYTHPSQSVDILTVEKGAGNKVASITSEGGFNSVTSSYFATSGGNVGIGTTTPDYQLHVSGSGSAAYIYVDNGYDGSRYSRVRIGDGYINFGRETDNLGGLRIFGNSNNPSINARSSLTFTQNSSNRLVVGEADAIRIYGSSNTSGSSALRIQSSTAETFRVYDDGSVRLNGSPINWNAGTKPYFGISQQSPGGALIAATTNTNKTPDPAAIYGHSSATGYYGGYFSSAVGGSLNLATGLGAALKAQATVGNVAAYLESITTSGTSGDAYGIIQHNYVQSSTLDSVTGMFIRNYFVVGSNTVTDFTGIRIADVQSNNITSITNRYGLKIDFDNTNTTNAYGIYQSSNTLNNYFNGKVGIGTSSPSASLHVVQQITANQIEYPLIVAGVDEGNTVDQFTESGIGVQFRLAGNDSAGDSLIGASIAAMRESTSDPNSSTGLAFLVSQDDTTLDEAMRIDQDGKIGIGTSNPQYPLHVSASVGSSTVAKFSSDGNTVVTIGRTTTTQAGDSTFTVSNLGRLSVASDNNIYLKPDNTTAMVLTTTGNVGIGLGAGAPSSKLHVSGGALFEDTVSILNLDATNNPRLVVGRQNAESLNFDVQDINSYIYMKQDADGDLDQSVRFGLQTASTGTHSFRWYFSDTARSSEAPKMVLSSDGSLQLTDYGSGTHTGTPAYRLSVDSSGNIIEESLGAGAVDGLGSGRYITRWEDTDTITSSSIYENNSNIGIGTTNPSRKLHVSIDNNDEIARFTSLQSNDAYIEFQSNTSQGFPKFGILTNDFVFLPSGSETVRFKSNGRVGIGTTNPYGQLEVYRDSYVDFRLRSTSNVYNTLQLAQYGTTGEINSNSGSLLIAAGAFNKIGHIALRTSGSERVRITDGGNVGIGTTSPAVKLDVNGTLRVNNEIQFVTDQMRIYRSGNHMRLRTASSDRMHIDSNGNVGIGTTSPSYKLELSGSTANDRTIGVDGDPVVYYPDQASSAYAYSIALGNGLRNATNTGGNTGTRNTAIGVVNQTSVTTGGGNVSVGSSTLEYNTTGNNNIAMGHLAGQSVRGSGNAALGFGTLRFVATGSNNVALGYYAGYEDISSNTITHTNNSLYLGSYAKASSATGNTNEIVIGYQAEGLGSNTAVLGNDSITTTALKGNVGIGTTSPSAKLHVFATGSVAQVLIQGKGDTLNQGSKLILSGSGTSTTRRATIELHGNHSSATDPSAINHYFNNTLKYQVGYRQASGRGYYISEGNGVNDSILYLNELDNNNVTITRDLTVEGIVTAQEFHTEFVSASIIYQSGSTKFGDTSDDVHSFTGSIHTTGSLEVNAGTATPFIKGSALRVAGQTNGAFGKLTLGTINHLEGDIGNFRFKNNNTTLMYMSGSGNVGIGTTTPSAKLDVAGDVKLGDTSSSALLDSTKVTTAATGAFDVYAVPTGSYDGAFFDYTAKSGSNARAGSIQAIWLGTEVNFNESVTMDFGDTSGLSLDVSISGSNMVLTGSCDTIGWELKVITRSI